MTGPLLTARTVADLLDVTPATVLRWTRNGNLPAVRLPSGQIRYRPNELEAWLDLWATLPDTSSATLRRMLPATSEGDPNGGHR